MTVTDALDRRSRRQELGGSPGNSGDIRSEPHKIAGIPRKQDIGLSLDRAPPDKSVVRGAAGYTAGD